MVKTIYAVKCIFISKFEKEMEIFKPRNFVIVFTVISIIYCCGNKSFELKEIAVIMGIRLH